MLTPQTFFCPQNAIGTSPKQQNLFPQPGRLSPGAMANAVKGYITPSNRKSISATKNEKRNAPVPPNVYSTLPLAPRHSQSIDAKEIRNLTKNQSDSYSTLPHSRNSDGKQSLDLHFSNKLYDPLPFDAELETADRYDKSKYSQSQSDFTTFGHKRSLSGESIGRNLHLAGAKLVLPSGEIPVLKPVDKNVIRPKLPPPGPPPSSAATPSSNNGL